MKSMKWLKVIVIAIVFSASFAQANGSQFLGSYRDPLNPQIIFAVFDYASTGGGVYLLNSRDGGQTWQKVRGPKENAMRKYGRQDTGDFFVSVGPPSNPRLFITYGAEALWKASSDLQWQRYAAPGHFILKLVPTAHPDTFFAILKGETGDALFRTDTGGTSWGKLNDKLPFDCGLGICEVQASPDGKVLIGEGYTSEDGGKSWKTLPANQQTEGLMAMQQGKTRPYPIAGTPDQIKAAEFTVAKHFEGLVHAQGLELTLKVGKVGINRNLNYDIKGWDAMIESVEALNDKLMALHFCITNNTGKDQSTWVPKDYKSTIYIVDNVGIKYPIIDFQGITKEPEKTSVPRGKTIRYSLMFPVFREGAKSFSFTEGGYVFKNIEIVYGQEAVAKNPVIPDGRFPENRADPAILLSKSEFVEEKEIIRIDEYIELLNVKLDQNTGVRFSYLYQETWSPFGPPDRTPERRKKNLCRGYWIPVVGEVPLNIDLTDEKTVEKIFSKAKEYAFLICPNLRSQRQEIWIMLYPDRFDKLRLGEEAPIFGRFDPYKSRNYDRLSQNSRNRIAEEAARVKREKEERQRREEQEAARLAAEREEAIRREAERLEAEKRRIEEEKRRVETEAHVARRLQEEKRRVEGEVTRVKNIPVYVRNLVFRDSAFVWPVTAIIPRDDEPGLADKIKRVEREADEDYNRPSVLHISKITSWDLNIQKFRNKNFLDFLVKHGYLEVETFNLHIERDNRNQEFKLFYYNDKLKPHILRQSIRSSGFAAIGLSVFAEFPPNSSEIVLAVRKLKSIDFTNEYEVTIPAKTKVYALTFTYSLEERLPAIPRINKLFQGKAKLYLDPDDGKWKLSGLELGDRGEDEYLKLMGQ